MENAKTPGDQKLVCVVCGQEKFVHYSLSLTKDAKGGWMSNPVCDKCRRGLIEEAKAKGRHVPMFSLASSLKEAERRNKDRAAWKPFFEKFVEKFGQDRKHDGNGNTEAKAKVKIAEVVELKVAAK